MTPEQRAALERLRKYMADHVYTVDEETGDTMVQYPKRYPQQEDDFYFAIELALSSHQADEERPLSPESLRAIGVEVGKVYKTEECDFRVDEELGVWALFEDFDGHRDSTLIAKLTSLSQARSLLAGLGVVGETKS